MAAIDSLIAQIEDEKLRNRLRAEVDALLENKEFGLVFQDHLPELVPIYSEKIRKGSTVAIRGDDLTNMWDVRAIVGKAAKCINKKSKEERLIPSEQLVIVLQFGEPIFPSLVPIDKVENGPDDAPWHTLIEADNYHALQLLEYLYAGQIDCIYIDPPYNSGARDWKYNNDYVDGNDAWRHSKWLSMMKRRLLRAKMLLNPADSVLIVTIDEKEYLRLGLLLGEIFSNARIQMVSSAINPAAIARAGEFGRLDEYLFFVFLGNAGPLKLSLDREWVSGKGRTHTGKIRWDLLRRSGTNVSRSHAPGCFYPIYVDPKTNKVVEIGAPLAPKDSTPPAIQGLVPVLPIRQNGSEGNWQWAPKTFRERLAEGRVRIGGNAKRGFVVYILKPGEYAKVQSGQFEVTGRGADGSLLIGENEHIDVTAIPGTQWRIVSHDATQYGSRLISKFLNDRKFPFPKSLYAVEDCIRFFVANKPEALILDFFAGSGTTAHAVFRLNKQDGGSRRCISVTNNEVASSEQSELREKGLRPGDLEWEKLGICNYITMPRIRAAVSGITSDGEPIKGDYKFTDEFPISDGFAANVEYFRLDFLDKNHVALGRQFQEILPLLWLRAGAIGPRPEIPKRMDIPEMLIPEKNPFAVLVDETKYSEFMLEVDKRPDLTHVFLVTDSEDAFHDMAENIKVPNVIQLYRDYLENFMINKGAKG